MADILLVEDDTDLRAVMARALERANHTVTALADGDDAVKTLSAGHRCDLVLTDLELPGRTGLEVIRAAKTADAAVPVVATSGKGRPVSVALDLARRCGADAVIAKPFKLSVMVALVDRVLRGEQPAEPETMAAEDDGDVVVIMPPDLLAAKVRGRSVQD